MSYRPLADYFSRDIRARVAQSTHRRRRALCWGLICGFEVLLPYWYVCFFVPMIIHRAVRDDARCAEKYGADWDTYIRRVPYVFVPGLV